MALLDKLPKGKKRERVGDGTYTARIVNIYRLGTQTDEYQGEEKVGKKVWITYEIPSKTIEINGEKRPMWVSQNVAESGHEKAWLTRIIMAIGEPVERLEDLIGKAVTVQVGTTAGGNDKVAAISGVPAEFRASIPPLANEPMFFDIDNPDMDVYNNLFPFLKEMISSAPEWKGASNPFE